jgi:3-oxoacyl-[acyl-carrier-protein] synthase II
VVISGLGPVSSIGIGREAFDRALFTGACGISRIASFDASGFPHQSGGEVHGFVAQQWVRTIAAAEWGRSAQFAAAAARLAAADAGLDLAETDLGRVHAVIGTTSGESVVSETLTAQIHESGFAGMRRQTLAQLPAERLAYAVSAELGLRGESMTLATACSASNYAIGYGYDLITSGEADVVFAGGADSVCRWAHAGFFKLGALARDACAPFDRDRAGIVTGEGGAVLVLESLEHARRREAPVYAEVYGYGVNCDARHPVAPDRASIAECMRLAHRNAEVKPAEVDYVCAHGTGTPANDLTEARALLEVFEGAPPPVSSIKSMIGHTMGAASGFGAMAGALAVRHGLLPPTINWRHPDPELAGIDPVPNVARPARVRVVQNNGFAFGGNNAIVMLGEPR